LCIKLARDQYLCRLWDIPEPGEAGSDDERLLENELYRKMEDVELVLRFFAHRQRDSLQRGALKVYLDDYLKYGNLFASEVLGSLEELFLATTKLVFDVMGYRAFWLWRFRHGHWDWLQRPTTVAYDTVMRVFSEHLDDGDALRAKSDVIQSHVPAFYEKFSESFEARYTNRANIKERDKLFSEFIREALQN
jgi:hypothetical protein